MSSVTAEEAGLDLVRWGTRFALSETEVRYREWHIPSSVPFNRAVLYVSLVNWSLAIPVFLMTGTSGATILTLLVLVAILPACGAGLVATYRRSLLSWMQPLTMIANTLAGTMIVAFTNWLVIVGDERGTVEGAVAASLLSNFVGFAVMRTRPAQAALSVGPYMVFEVALLGAHMRSGRISADRMVGDALTVVLAVITGLVINVVLDVTGRRTFRQELIIEAQKETISRERAKSEAVLKQELGHQVAERSREIGVALARVDAPIAAKDLVAGERFAVRYKVVRALGRGGMGAVYEVERLTDSQRLALKVIIGNVSAKQAARFAREAEIGARLRHPNLVSIVDVGIAAQGAPFLVMELVTGGSLEDRRASFGDAQWALPLLLQIARGLAALHDAGVVHRDLKPANVLLSEDETTVRISDFGISRLGANEQPIDPHGPTVDEVQPPGKLTKTGALLGTPVYMAPEAADGGRGVDTPSDIFAFGIVAWEMLTGRPPFEMPPVIMAMAKQSIPMPGDVDAAIPGPLGKMILACLHEDPAERPRIHDIVRALSS